jgi:hypothetical protein
MATERLDIRLDRDRHRKLRELAARYQVPVSETVRRLIDRGHEEWMKERRLRAVQELGMMSVEDVPDPETLSKQLDRTLDIGDVP